MLRRSAGAGHRCSAHPESGTMSCAARADHGRPKPRLRHLLSRPPALPALSAGLPTEAVLRDLVLRGPPFVDIEPLSMERFDTSALRPEYNLV
jgi:hypothetical protein